MTTETVTEYVTRDGCRFRTDAKARDHEAMLDEVQPILARLPQGHVEHGKYVRHDAAQLRKVKADLFRLVVKHHGKDFPKWQEFNPDEVHLMSIVGRVMDDYDGPLANAWGKLACFDFDLGRQYDQPYFVSHPDEAVEQWPRSNP